MGHGLTRKQEIQIGVKGFIILLIVTLLEVGVALIGNGHIISGVTLPKIVMIPLMIGLSLYKAYYIVSIFMHLGSETKPMAASIVLPMLLFIWAITAFLWEGGSWRANQEYVEDRNVESVEGDYVNLDADGEKTEEKEKGGE